MPKAKVNRKPGIHLHKTIPSRIYSDLSKSEWYWILISSNGKTIAKSSETYKRRDSAIKSISIMADMFAADNDGPKCYDHSEGGVPDEIIY